MICTGPKALFTALAIFSLLTPIMTFHLAAKTPAAPATMDSQPTPGTQPAGVIAKAQLVKLTVARNADPKSQGDPPGTYGLPGTSVDTEITLVNALIITASNLRL